MSTPLTNQTQLDYFPKNSLFYKGKKEIKFTTLEIVENYLQ